MRRDNTEAMISCFVELRRMGTDNGYKEAEEALNGLEALSWFDNFGEPAYLQRLSAAEAIFREYPALSNDFEQLANECEFQVEG